MSFADRLIHALLIHTRTPQLDGYGNQILDERGQPLIDEAEVSVHGLIQPKSAREVALISQGGASVSDHTIYLGPDADLTGADYIKFDDAADTRQYEIVGIRDAAGLGHHLECDARLVA